MNYCQAITPLYTKQTCEFPSLHKITYVAAPLHIKQTYWGYAPVKHDLGVMPLWNMISVVTPLRKKNFTPQREIHEVKKNAVTLKELQKIKVQKNYLQRETKILRNVKAELICLSNEWPPLYPSWPGPASGRLIARSFYWAYIETRDELIRCFQTQANKAWSLKHWNMWLLWKFTWPMSWSTELRSQSD